MLVNNPLELIGNTPLVRLNNLSQKYDCNIYVKLEKYNLNHSAKDRAVKQMILSALNKKIINNQTTIIEPSSGNTGISIASICAALKLKCIIIMPSNVSEERKKIVSLFGAKIVFTNPKDKMNGAMKKTKELLKKIKNSYMLNQFKNIENINAHYLYTANEIINDLPLIDGYFASFGTSGSLIGVAKKLKEYNKNIKIISVKPKNKNHKIDGVYSNIKLINYDKSLIDFVESVDDIDTYSMINYIAETEGISLGISSCLAIQGALNYLKHNKLQNVVILCCDGIERYLSNRFIFENFDKSQIYKDIDFMYDSLMNNDIQDEIFFKYKIHDYQLKKLIKTINKDALFNYLSDPAALDVNQVKETYPGFYAIVLYRIANILWKNNQKRIARIISEYVHTKTAIDIHPGCQIDEPFAIDHGTGIVIGETTIIGKNVRLYHNVTLGAKSLNNIDDLRNKKRHPTIKNNVIIYSGALILGGDVVIGNNVIIGSNVVVTHSIEDNKILTLNKEYKIKENKI